MSHTQNINDKNSLGQTKIKNKANSLGTWNICTTVIELNNYKYYMRDYRKTAEKKRNLIYRTIEYFYTNLILNNSNCA